MMSANPARGADSDCTATGFSGEGRCIERAVVGSLCEYHAEHVTGNAYADPDRAADDLAPRGSIGVWPPFYGCRCCGCDMDDHNDPRQGGSCTNCGDCEGWL